MLFYWPIDLQTQSSRISSGNCADWINRKALLLCSLCCCAVCFSHPVTQSARWLCAASCVWVWVRGWPCPTSSSLKGNSREFQMLEKFTVSRAAKEYRIRPRSRKFTGSVRLTGHRKRQGEEKGGGEGAATCHCLIEGRVEWKTRQREKWRENKSLILSKEVATSISYTQTHRLGGWWSDPEGILRPS